MKLSTKISIIMVSVVVFSGLIIGGLTLESTTRSFDKYLKEVRQSEINEWYQIYSNYYEDHDQSWIGVHQLMDNNPSKFDSIQDSYLRPIVLVSKEGYILAHPTKGLVGVHTSTQVLERATPIVYENKTIGYLLPIDFFDHKFWVLQNGFVDDVRSSLIKGILVTSVVALCIAFAMSQNIVRPLKDLILSIRVMEHQERSKKVVVYSDDEIGELATAFNHMSSEIEKNNLVRTQLFADVSHELRTPLTAMVGTLENKLMRTESLEPVEISALYDETLRLVKLVNELQNLSKIDSGQLNMLPMEISFKDFLDDFILLLEAEAQAREIELRIDLPLDLGSCYADPERLKQIVLNLISNAMRYTGNGGEVCIKAWQEKEFFAFSITDSGVGMDKDEERKVFDRFYRSDQSRARETGGSGLGLAITKGLVEAHKGIISVKSEKNVGTSFTVRLPNMPQ